MPSNKYVLLASISKTTIQLKKTFFSTILLLTCSLMLISWGGTGHSKISEASALSFNQQMQDFNAWVGFLRTHASDADYRKSTDPNESPKHYIDIDNYTEFLTKGRIPQTLDSMIAIHGLAVVTDNGTLPWATIAAFDSLRNCMQRRNFAKAQIFAADLGHYVGDGHMPMHITKNYDGQLTGNKGIHSRYETTMINDKISQIVYLGTPAAEISNVNQYVFNYIYSNFAYSDSIIQADNYAKTLASGSTTSAIYKNALWAKTQSFTIPLFTKASNALATLIYTAWVQAGKPPLNITELSDPATLTNIVLEQNTPNPFSSSTRISYFLKENTKILIQVRDINGAAISTLVNDSLPQGNHTCEWIPTGEPAGIYFLVLNSGKFIEVRKIIYSGE